MDNMRKTKIVATLGLVSDDRETLGKMIEAGLNVARFNFSHGDYHWHKETMQTIRSLSEEMGEPVGIMADLQGPRIRTVVEDEMDLQKDELIEISDTAEQRRAKKSAFGTLLLDYPGITHDLKEGNEIRIEDGLIRLKVVGKNKGRIQARVVHGGVVKNHKGVNVPDASFRFGAFTPKDEKDLEFALGQDVDFVALSFVSNAKEINSVREKIKKLLGRENNLPLIVSKIERKEAIKNIDSIIKASDVIMVARGDLGIELDESNVVIYQKEIIAKCLKTGKPVIVATQMLDSMINNPIPTRAEVSDVSNAVIDHADAVMLSGETASGRYPIESVRTMREIIEKTEASPFDDLEHGFLGDSHTSVSAAVAHSAHELTKDSGAKAILVASISGLTARMMARHRPEQPLYVMTNNEKTHNQLSLLWGTESFVLPDCRTLDELIARSIKTLIKQKLVKAKDRVVVVTGRPHVAREHMSLVKVEEIR